jgi:hypothetical protein
MIGSFDDQLARLAFGDLSEEEARRLHDQARQNPAMSARLREYESLRMGLHQLREVPEDQLSKERLREALLSRALKPERRAFWQPAWAAVAAATFCVAYGASWLVQQNKDVNPRVVMAEPTTVRAAIELPQPTIRTAMAPVRTVSAISPKRKVVRRRKARPAMPQYVEPDPTSLVALRTDGSAISHPVNAPDERRGESFDRGESVPSIVLIDQPKDLGTSGQKATEVGSPNDVLIGG